MQRVLQKGGEIIIPGGDMIKLALKVAVSAGNTRRFLVGNPEIQTLDVLAGNSLYRLAEGEHLAEKGDIILAPEVAEALKNDIVISEWRFSHEQDTGKDQVQNDAMKAFGVLGSLKAFAPPAPWPVLVEDSQASPSKETSLSKIEEAAVDKMLLFSS